MTSPVAGTSPVALVSSPVARSSQLEKTARQLEGVFVLQMLKAMRATVPKSGITESNSGEDTFTSMLDEKIADRIPAQWKHGLTDALMKQLVGRESASHATAAPTATSPIPEQSR
jgi:Rod binding domain-containing protein